MTAYSTELPSYPENSDVKFSIKERFGTNGLLSANGDVFFAQQIIAGLDRLGGVMVSAGTGAAATPVALRVERSFASGHLVLANQATGETFLATLVVPHSA